jgi:hypothetical protein
LGGAFGRAAPAGGGDARWAAGNERKYRGDHVGIQQVTHRAVEEWTLKRRTANHLARGPFLDTPRSPDPLAALRTTRLPYDLVRDLTGLRDAGGPNRLDALEALLAHEQGADALAGLFLVGARSLLQELAAASHESVIDGTSTLAQAVPRLAEASRGGKGSERDRSDAHPAVRALMPRGL